MAEDNKLSDEQIDQLNNYEPVKLARAVFTERLNDVIEHPPQPRSVAALSQERIKGFKK